MKEKLKTLKDFKEVECGDYLPHRCEGREFLKEELREEAKKWINVTNEEKEKWIRGGSTCYRYETADAVIDFIKYFFNLEDEK